MKDFIVAMAVSVPMSLLNGFVLLKLWGWFLIALGAPPVTLIQCVGIRLVVGVFTYKHPSKEDVERGIGTSTTLSIIYCGLVLLFGYVWQLFL